MTVKRRNHGRSKPAGARGRVKRVRAALTRVRSQVLCWTTGCLRYASCLVKRSHKLERQCQLRVGFCILVVLLRQHRLLSAAQTRHRKRTLKWHTPILASLGSRNCPFPPTPSSI
jgi:hypothetical protein